MTSARLCTTCQRQSCTSCTVCTVCDERGWPSPSVGVDTLELENVVRSFNAVDRAAKQAGLARERTEPLFEIPESARR